MFFSEASLFSGGPHTGWVEGGPKFRYLRAGEKLNQSLTNKHFVLIGQWRQAIRLIIYEAKNENWRVCIWPCHKQTKVASESFLGHRGKGGSSLKEVISQTERVGDLLIFTVSQHPEPEQSSRLWVPEQHLHLCNQRSLGGASSTAPFHRVLVARILTLPPWF